MNEPTATKPKPIRRIADFATSRIRGAAGTMARVTKAFGNSLNVMSPPPPIPHPDDLSRPNTSIMTSQITPPPNIDRYPIIIGSKINQTYVSSVERAAITGYRQQQVDVYTELMDHMPEVAGMFIQRVLAVTTGRLDFVPPERFKEDQEAIDYALEVQNQVESIPKWSQVKYRLLFQGLWNGLSCEEKIFDFEPFPKEDGIQWRIIDSEQIHTRRLSYPLANIWQLRIFDQGLGGGAGSNAATFGVAVSDLPMKYAVHAPTLRAEYPTREGLGRLASTYMMVKRLVMRVSAQDYERFVKPWVIAYFNTDPTFGGNPRLASAKDISSAQAAVAALGMGSLTSATLPNSVKVELIEQASKLSQSEFSHYLDSSLALLIQGQPFTSLGNKFGSKGTTEGAQDDSTAIAKEDASQFCETLTEHYARVLMKLNHPDKLEKTPRAVIKFARKRAPLTYVEAVTIGLPLDGTRVAEEEGMPLLPKDAGPDAVRCTLVAPTPANMIKTNVDAPTGDDAKGNKPLKAGYVGHLMTPPKPEPPVLPPGAKGKGDK